MDTHKRPSARWLLATLGVLAVTQGVAQDTQGSNVLAKVGDQPITEAMLRFELGNATLPGKLQNAAERAALQGLIARKLMAQEAERRKLDTTPSAAMALQRADDLALVAVLERSLVAQLPPIGEREVAKFIADHPASFAKRKRIWVEQVMARNVDPDTVRQIGGLDRLEDITALLDRVGADYIRSAAVLDTLDMEPQAGAAIANLARDAVFVTPRGEGALEISRIGNSETAPVAPADAQVAAQRYLKHARDASVAQAEIAKIVAAGQAKIRINPKYQ